MKRPLIGIAPSGGGEGEARVCTAYLEAIWASGGMGVILPNRCHEAACLSEYAACFDGFLLAGGGDLHPFYYKEAPSAELSVDGVRDAFEMALWPVIFPTGKPILGVCRGMQVLNVCLGGSLLQEIGGHRDGWHRVAVKPHSFLYGITGQEAWQVNSFHHQAIGRVADRLAVEAVTQEGVIEAVHHEGHPYLVGVQFHPERMTDHDPAAKRLFDSFVTACGTVKFQ